MYETLAKIYNIIIMFTKIIIINSKNNSKNIVEINKDNRSIKNYKTVGK